MLLYHTILDLVALQDVALCDEEELERLGRGFATSLGNLAQELAADVLLGAIGNVAEAVRDAALYAGDSAWRLWRRLRDRAPSGCDEHPAVFLPRRYVGTNRSGHDAYSGYSGQRGQGLGQGRDDG